MQDIPVLIQGLERSPHILAQFVNSITEEKLHQRRGDGFWTVAQHVSHLAQVQPMLQERLQRFVDEERPSFVPFVPADGETEERPADLETTDALYAFERCRREQITVLGRAEEADWQKTGSHPEYERYSLYILVRHILMHDFWHMYRIEEIWLTRDIYLTTLL